jgi:hypothetical protein
MPAAAGGFRWHRKKREMTVTVQDRAQQDRAQAVDQAARLLGHDDQVSRQALASLWDEAFGQGRLAALDELQDRFCVCMK